MAGRGGAGLVSRLPAGARLPNCLEPTHQQLPGRGQLAPALAPASSKFHRGSPPSQSQGDGHPVSRATAPYKCSHGAPAPQQSHVRYRQQLTWRDPNVNHSCIRLLLTWGSVSVTTALFCWRWLPLSFPSPSFTTLQWRTAEEESQMVLIHST